MLETWLLATSCVYLSVWQRDFPDWVGLFSACCVPCDLSVPFKHQKWPHSLNTSSGHEELGSQGPGNAGLMVSRWQTADLAAGRAGFSRGGMPRGVPSCAQAEGLTEPSILVDAFTSWCYEEEGYLQAGRGWFFRCGFGFCCVVVVVFGFVFGVCV